jgi:hypothetical protein
MERHWFHSVILRDFYRVYRGAVIVVLVALSLHFGADMSSGDSLESVSDMLSTTRKEVIELPADDLVLIPMITAVTGTYDTAEAEAKWKHDNYVSDHGSLSSILPDVPVAGSPIRVFSDDLTSYVNRAISSDNTLTSTLDKLAPGIRSPTSSKTVSQIYEDRVGEWRDYARGVLSADNFAANDVKKSLETISKLKRAAQAAGTNYLIQPGGYIQLEQAGGQISNFLSQELSKLRVDMNRQIAAKTGFVLNEQQERADAMTAFEQAVTTWTDSGSAGSGY